jgi:hypothetical protein
MGAEHTTMRVWKKTLKNLRMIYALTGESMVEILDRIVKQELDRVRQEQDETSQGIQVQHLSN